MNATLTGEAWDQNIEKNLDLLHGLCLEKYIVTFQKVMNGMGFSRKFSSGRGYYMEEDKLGLIQNKVNYLDHNVAGVYCIDQNTFFTSDPALAKRLQEMNWPKNIKVVQTADNADLINKVTKAFCNR
jgi:hypothetical protein